MARDLDHAFKIASERRRFYLATYGPPTRTAMELPHITAARRALEAQRAEEDRQRRLEGLAGPDRLGPK